jgi:hypothetical protein
LKSIKEIYDNSDKFNDMLNNLTNAINQNEERLQNLLQQYEDTLKSFEEFDGVIKELNEIDNIFNKILI